MSQSSATRRRGKLTELGPSPSVISQPSWQLTAYVAAESTTEPPASRLIQANEDDPGSHEPQRRRTLKDQVDAWLKVIRGVGNVGEEV